MSWRGTVIVNLESGPGDTRVAAGHIAEAFAAHGIEPAIALVNGRDVADRARRALNKGASVVVAAGGDGTVSAVASVLAGTEAALGIIPLGTLNHFAKDLHIPLDIEGATQTIIAGRETPVDVGELNGRP